MILLSAAFVPITCDKQRQTDGQIHFLLSQTRGASPQLCNCMHALLIGTLSLFIYTVDVSPER